MVAFPAHGAGGEERKETMQYWNGRSEQPTQRTVRRKKSSLDLRDIFKRGAVATPYYKSML